MMEFVIGALGAAAFFRFRGLRRGGGRGRWGGSARGFRQTWMLNRLSEALDASPAQEKVMRQVLEEIEGVTAGFRDEWEKTRQAAARASRGDTFDGEGLREAWTRHDQVVAEMRVALVDGLRKLHEALEPAQRQQLADLIEGGFRHGWRHHGGFGGRFGRFGHFGHDYQGRGRDRAVGTATRHDRFRETRSRRGAPGLRECGPMMRVLLIDDDRRLQELLSSYLGQNGVQVTAASDGAQGLTVLDSGVFDAVLLDVMMPGIDGLEVCRRIRTRSQVPILMLTAKGDETDRVVGLELGADDYIAKPFGPRELLARLRAVLRRATPDLVAEQVRVGDLVADVTSRSVKRGERAIDLTGIEFDLLLALMRRAGRVVPRDALLSESGRLDTTVGERTVDVHISHVRQKLGDDPRSPRLIKTVRGVGYVLTKDED